MNIKIHYGLFYGLKTPGLRHDWSPNPGKLCTPPPPPSRVDFASRRKQTISSHCFLVLSWEYNKTLNDWPQGKE